MKKMLIALATALMIIAGGANALSVEVKGLFKSGVILVVDGKQRVVREGQRSPEGILLVSVDDGGATMEIEGQQQYIAMNRTISTSYSEAEKAEARIPSGAGGHYKTPGRINGHAVEFMVDTGATIVAMNVEVAQRLGINYRAGEQIPISTAAGVITAYKVTLDRVSVGTVEVNNVEAAVSVGSFPQEILLGNSYLSRVEMRRENGIMILQSRY